MAGAYAALCSLMSVLDNIQNHPNPPISLHKLQVDALVEKIAFLQEFLQLYSHSEATDGLASPIRDAAFAAEDAIESYLMDEICRSSSSVNGGDGVYPDLQKVMDDMDLIKKRTMEMKEIIVDDEDHQHMSSTSNASLVSPSPGKKPIMVGFEDVLNKILDKLLRSQSSSREIIPIVGMGGIGKTTLALNTYEQDCTMEHFDIRCWITISQKYNLCDILLEISRLVQRNKNDVEDNLSSHMSKEELGVIIHKRLFGRRYLIVMDDMWSAELWDEINHFFPDNNDGSKILITTRISTVAFELTNSIGVQLDFLDESESWNLLHKTVFGEDACPLELEENGRMIAKNCKGLPLSIVVIGGLLAKSKQTVKYWEYIGRNINSIVNVEEDERCLKILYISYRQLPIHLKLCFLYMGVYPEDARIRVSWLIKLLVAEGFLKPIGSNTMEDIVREFIEELVDRNLILNYDWGSTGKIKYCKIHDVLRDLCIKEAEREKFLYVFGEQNFDPQRGISTQRRIVAHRRTMDEYPDKFIDTLQSTVVHARSIFIEDLSGESWHFNSRLLRILKATDHTYTYFEDNIKVGPERGIFQLYNLRYLAVAKYDDLGLEFDSSLSMFWNLQTLLILDYDNGSAILPVDIWKLAQVRHVKFAQLHLPNPSGDDNLILRNLQTLSWVWEFKCGEEVVKRIPNIRKLDILYYPHEDYSDYHLDNIRHLGKLEHLKCIFLKEGSKAYMSNLQRHLIFPGCLKKLYIGAGKQLHWEYVSIVIGSLPSLEKLSLREIAGPEWIPLEGKFLRLKRLAIFYCWDLKDWIAESSHFPLLNRLYIKDAFGLAEIPCDIGEINTLERLHMNGCSDSAITSAEKIAQEQEELGNSLLQFRIILNPKNNYKLDSPATPNFLVLTEEEWEKSKSSYFSRNDE